MVPDGYLSEDEGMDSDDEKSKRAMKLKEEGGEGGDADNGNFYPSLFSLLPPLSSLAALIEYSSIEQ